MPGREFHAAHALLADGWAESIRIRVDAQGRIEAIGPGTAHGAEPLPGIVVGGMPNLHSHAFQYALAGLAEVRGPGADSFWTWREWMYRVASALDPDALHLIARAVYARMLAAGYTEVCEFHYVHGHREGVPAGGDTAMADAVIAAAAETGIGMTLLPVLYQRGGFRDQPLSTRQARFQLGTEAWLRLIETLRQRESPTLRIGMALHSLRAVTPAVLREVCALPLAADRPIHIHIAEQPAEVEECLAVHGCRPVEWLLRETAVDARWCLVHATHMRVEERQALARSGAVAGLCPTTEANLGDGQFPTAEFLNEGGVFGIGSDSQVSLDPAEELRWLEYQARLTSGSRNVLVSEQQRHVGSRLWQAALSGGAQAAGWRHAGLSVGARADFLCLEHDGLPAAPTLDRFVFAPGTVPLAAIYVAGRRVDHARAREDWRAAEAACRGWQRRLLNS